MKYFKNIPYVLTFLFSLNVFAGSLVVTVNDKAKPTKVTLEYVTISKKQLGWKEKTLSVGEFSDVGKLKNILALSSLTNSQKLSLKDKDEDDLDYDAIVNVEYSKGMTFKYKFELAKCPQQQQAHPTKDAYLELNIDDSKNITCTYFPPK